MSSRGSSQLRAEEALFDYVERLQKFRAGRRAVHVRLSLLEKHNRRGHHMRIAVATFEQLLEDFKGAIFKLGNDDLLLICKGATVADIDDAVLRLRYLFSEDPLLSSDQEDRTPFCSWFSLETDYDQLRELVRTLRDGSESEAAPETGEATDSQATGKDAAPDKAQSGANPKAAPTIKPLEAGQLAKIEVTIAQADLSNVITSQRICAVVRDQRPQTVFHEIFTSIGTLQSVLLPDVNFAANPWLFQELTRHLDRRMIAYLMQNAEIAGHGPISINLNVATLLSHEFAEFDELLRVRKGGQIIIEVQMIDIFSDLGAFLFARDHLRERGYRFCLDGISHLALPLIDRGRLGVDLVKLLWSADLHERLEGPRAGELRDAVARADAHRFVLARCDSEKALEVGRSLGIGLYQGHLLDSLVREQAREETPPQARTG